MKVEYINPFIEAAQTVFQMLCCGDPKVSKAYLKSSPFPLNHIVVVIGFVGKIRGQVYFEMSEISARSIASAMMGGMPVDILDELSKSAISELGNMIMGSVSTLFANNMTHIDITTPTLLEADELKLSNIMATIVIPMELASIGNININVNMEEND